MKELKEMTCTKAGYFYLGHFRQGWLEVLLETDHSGVSFNPNIKEPFELFKLFEVFGVDPEDGKYINDIEGRKCLVEFDENDRVKAIYNCYLPERYSYEVRKST